VAIIIYYQHVVKLITVSILGDKALPVLEIIPARGFYDYVAKYADGVDESVRSAGPI